MPSIMAARRNTPADRAPLTPVLAGDRDRIVSVVVVRDGVAETFVLGTPPRDALDRGGLTAIPVNPGAPLGGPAPLLSLAPSHQPDPVDDAGVGGEAGESLLAEIVSLLADTSVAPRSQPQPFNDELTSAEERVLRYLPTNLTAWEIAEELYVSLNTVKTHMRHIYAKLGAHRRREAVERARTFGLLAPSSHLRPAHQALA